MTIKALRDMNPQERYLALPPEAILEQWVIKVRGEPTLIAVVHDLIGHLFGLSSSGGPCAWTNSYLIILPESWWLECPKHLLRAAAAHEMGHVYYQHKRFSYQTEREQYLHQETQADVYAVGKTNHETVIELLNYCIADMEKQYILCLEQGYPVTQEELEYFTSIMLERINRIKAHKRRYSIHTPSPSET